MEIISHFYFLFYCYKIYLNMPIIIGIMMEIFLLMRQKNYAEGTVLEMEKNQRYMGTPNGIMLCVDRYGKGIIEGRMYHGYQKEGIPFYGYEEIIKTAEKLFNALGFPFMGTGFRDISGNVCSYGREKDMERVLSEEELLGQHGNTGTFVIKVQHRQHSSWQGRVTYLEEDKSVCFRSLLELIKIIDAILDGREEGFRV